MQGYLLALPPVGNKDYCAGYNGNAAGRVVAPYVAGDPVVECSKSVSFGDTGAAGWAGARLGSGGYTPGTLERLPRPMGARSDENSHEIDLIRAALLGKAQRAQVVLAEGMRNVTPWATYVSFADMLDGRPVSYAAGGAANIVTRDNLRRVLTNYRFARHFEAFLDMLKSAVADPKGYRGYHQDATYQLAGERVLVALEMCGHIDSDNRDVIVDTVGTQVAALLGYAVKKEYVRQGWKVRKQPVADGDGVALTADALLGQDFNTRIGLGLILRALEQKENTRLADYEKTPELKLCLEVALPDVSGRAVEAGEAGLSPASASSPSCLPASPAAGLRGPGARRRTRSIRRSLRSIRPSTSAISTMWRRNTSASGLPRGTSRSKSWGPALSAISTLCQGTLQRSAHSLSRLRSALATSPSAAAMDAIM